MSPPNEKRNRVRQRLVAARFALGGGWDLVQKFDAGAPVEVIVSAVLDRVAASPQAADRWLTMREVRALVPFSATHIWRLVRAGDFPAPQPIGQIRRVTGRASRVAWSERAVLAWRERRIADAA